MVENRALIIVHVGRFLFDKEQIASHLEHVVCRAGFRVALADIAGHSMCRPPHLAFASTTVSIHTAGHNHAPVPLNGLEITRTSISIDIRVAHGRVFGVTDELWNVLVGVQVVEDIDTSTTVVNELVSVEKCGGLKKFATVLVLGDVVQIHQRIIHAAVFTTDVDVPHLLQLGFGAFAQTRIGPMSDAFSQVERVGITGKLVSGNQTGKNLVLRVPRCPNLAIGSIFLQCLELPLAIGGKEAGVAVAGFAVILHLAQGISAFLQAGDELVDLVENRFLPRFGIRLGEHVQCMSGKVAAQQTISTVLVLATRVFGIAPLLFNSLV